MGLTSFIRHPSSPHLMPFLPALHSARGRTKMLPVLCAQTGRTFHSLVSVLALPHLAVPPFPQQLPAKSRNPTTLFSSALFLLVLNHCFDQGRFSSAAESAENAFQHGRWHQSSHSDGLAVPSKSGQQLNHQQAACQALLEPDLAVQWIPQGCHRCCSRGASDADCPRA